MKLLIDGDPIVYRIGFACQSTDKETGLVTADPDSFTLHSCKLFVNEIIKDTQCESYKIFLTGKNNFRHKIRSDYKENRSGSKKPYHYENIRGYLIEYYDAQVVDGMEADDAMALLQTDDTAIATIDKDLLMVPGLHYNYIKKEWKEVTEESGTKFFYAQMLTGDKVDNIIGINGIGPKKAEKLLSDNDRETWDNLVIDLYIEEFGEDGFQRAVEKAVENSHLLWMLQRGRTMPMDFHNANQKESSNKKQSKKKSKKQQVQE